MPFFIIVFLFIFVPVVEISLLINVGKAIGGFNTIAFVIFTAVLGAYLVKQQGLATLHRLQQETSAGRVPALQMAEGVMLLFAGAVLLTPGFVTDALGFAFLIPFVRQGIIRWFLSKGLVKAQASYTSGSGPFGEGSQRVKDSNVIEGEYRDG